MNDPGSAESLPVSEAARPEGVPPAPPSASHTPPHQNGHPASTHTPPDPVTTMAVRAVYPLGFSRSDVRRLLLVALVGAATLTLLWQVQDILPPFVIAFFLAALLDPTLRAWERKGRSRVRSILTLYLLALLAVTLFLWFVGPPVWAQLNDLTRNSNSYVTELQHRVDVFLSGQRALLLRLNIQEQSLSELLDARGDMIRTRVTALLGGLTLFLSGLFSKVLWVIIIPIAGFFLMRDFPVLRARTIALFPEPYQEEIDRVSHQVVVVFSDYLRGLARICTLYAITAFVLFWMLGLNYALFLGLLAGLFYAMPIVGQLFTASAAGLVAYLMPYHRVLVAFSAPEHSAGYALLVVGCVILANNVFDQLIYPRVVGGSVGLHPVASIFALMAGATLFGVAGMLLAVPVAASIQIVLMACFPRIALPPPGRLLDEPIPPRQTRGNAQE